MTRFEQAKRVGRYFESGAYRDDNTGKPDYSGFLSPAVLVMFGKYMMKHQLQSDGVMRDSDNWKAGIPKEDCFESLVRHIMDLWLEEDGFQSRDGVEEALGGILFNAMAYWLAYIKEQESDESTD